MATYLLLFIGGLALGLVFLYFFKSNFEQQLKAAALRHDEVQQRVGLLQAEKDQLLARATEAEGSNKFLLQEYQLYNELQQEHQRVEKTMVALEAQLVNANERLSTQKNELEQMSERFRFEFRNLAQGIMEEKTAQFTQVNEEKMKAILDPLKTELVDFKKKVDETYDKESKERFTLGKEVQRLVEMSQLVSQEANNLTTALKGNNKQQGHWGEMILESILNYSGLTNGREYLVQEFIRDSAGNIIRDENGKGLQPDITIIYPDQRKIIIDSKVSLVAWEQCISCDDATQQKQFLKEHIQSLRTHIDGLTRKNYPRYAQALDYVLLFIPIEPAFLEAVKADLQLWKYAYDKRIMLVSPTNLLAILKIIADLWKVEQQNRHAIEIADKAGGLYDKFAGFIDNFELIGRKLQDAQQSYESAFKQLSNGRGNIITRVEELKKMGANAAKQLPDRLVETKIEE